jgi:hypothetical protein
MIEPRTGVEVWVMRAQRLLAATAAAACLAVAGPAAWAAADTKESAQDVINRLQSEGYTVNIDRIGTAPMSECVVTNVRNPKQVTQWVPYTGPGARNDHVLVLDVVSQSVSVTLDCSR